MMIRLAALILIALTAAYADVDAALRAYNQGEFQDAMREALPFAQQGDVQAQHLIGMLYYDGAGTPKNYAEALKWFGKAADQGDTDAQSRLGDMYTSGQGVPNNYAEAAKWFRKAADQGDTYAQFHLGDIYSSQGALKDYAEAMKWVRKAADGGYAPAQFGMGYMYAKGWGVAPDYGEAMRWYRKGAEQEDTDAGLAPYYQLGHMYYNGIGMVQDYTEAAKWFRKAADQGNILAQRNLGYMYANGQGVSRDSSEAVKWYVKAADHGNANAETDLGSLYYRGQWVTQDYGEAVRWYRKAAEQGNAEAQYALGLMYEDGKGTPQDYTKAFMWLNLAASAASGDTEKEYGNARDQLALRLTPEQIAEAQHLTPSLPGDQPSSPLQQKAPLLSGSPREMGGTAIFKQFARRILLVTCALSGDTGNQGSGVLISADGFILTNAHVVEGCLRITATYVNGTSRQPFEAALKFYDRRIDTAVLKVVGPSFDHFDLAARIAQIGEGVYAIGNPLGFVQTITYGLVSSGNRDLYGNGVLWIQHSAPISPGSSGGALISSRGELLGINTSSASGESQNLNFAVPAATLTGALQRARTFAGSLTFAPEPKK